MANGAITVKINGQQIEFDVQPQIINGRTMVPLRAIFEVLGASVDWTADTQTVTSIKGNTTISLTINNPAMYVNGVGVTLDSPACLIGGRTLVPVRAISEAFRSIVEWDSTNNTVSIRTSHITIKSAIEKVGARYLFNEITDNRAFSNIYPTNKTEEEITKNLLNQILNELGFTGNYTKKFSSSHSGNMYSESNGNYTVTIFHSNIVNRITVSIESTN